MLKFPVFMSILLLLAAGCSNSSGNSKNEPDPNPDLCGNGELDPGEPCDGELSTETSCESLGYYGGTLACSRHCELDTRDCAAWGRCGDGLVQDALEECDLLNLGGKTCQDFGFTQGSLTCRADCTLDKSSCSGDPGYCGDGVLAPETEECEPGLPLSTSCQDLGFWNGIAGCSNQCGIDKTNCTSLLKVVPAQFAMYVLDGSGLAWSWGNSTTSIGHGWQVHAIHPVPITLPAPFSVVDIDAFERHGCLVDNHHNAWCWGHNASGQIGDGTNNPAPWPTTVSTLGIYFSKISKISVGFAHSCALTTTGMAVCWGVGANGTIGNGANVNVNTPTNSSMPVDRHFTDISSCAHFSCALADNGSLYCWGSNLDGQLGIGNTTNRNIPTRVILDHVSFVQFDTAHDSVCGIVTDGRMYCWGRNNYGQLGLGDYVMRTLPALRDPPPGATWKQVAMGFYHGCGLSTDDRVWCWGQNNFGQLGTDTETNSPVPLEVIIPAPVRSIAAGGNISCAQTDEGDVWCWGHNVYGQIGQPMENHFAPTPLVKP